MVEVLGTMLKGGMGLLKFDGPMGVDSESSDRDVNFGQDVGNAQDVDNAGVPPAARPRRRRRVQPLVTQLP